MVFFLENLNKSNFGKPNKGTLANHFQENGFFLIQPEKRPK